MSFNMTLRAATRNVYDEAQIKMYNTYNICY